MYQDERYRSSILYLFNKNAHKSSTGIRPKYTASIKRNYCLIWNLSNKSGTFFSLAPALHVESWGMVPVQNWRGPIEWACAEPTCDPLGRSVDINQFLGRSRCCEYLQQYLLGTIVTNNSNLLGTLSELPFPQPVLSCGYIQSPAHTSHFGGLMPGKGRTVMVGYLRTFRHFPATE